MATIYQNRQLHCLWAANLSKRSLAYAVIEAVVKAVNLPVTLKTRLGWDERLLNAPELARLGADIHVHAGEAVVKGVPELHGAPVMATDLRASASLAVPNPFVSCSCNPNGCCILVVIRKVFVPI